MIKDFRTYVVLYDCVVRLFNSVVVTVVALGSSALADSVVLTWDPNPAEQMVIQYVVYATNDGADIEQLGATEYGQTEVELTDLSLGLWTFYVTAVNAYGVESPPSELTVLLGTATPAESEPLEYQAIDERMTSVPAIEGAIVSDDLTKPPQVPVNEAIDERVTSEPTIEETVISGEMAKPAEASVHGAIDERVTGYSATGEANVLAGRWPRLRSGSLRLRDDRRIGNQRFPQPAPLR